MAPFVEIDGFAVIGRDGLYRGCKVYTYEDEIYAAYSGGYLRLYKGNKTSRQKVYILKTEIPSATFASDGRMILKKE